MKYAVLYCCLVLLSGIISGSANAQCIIDSTQTASGIYPDTLPDATAGQLYDEDITFVMVTDTLGLTIYNYQITNVVGLPVGISWQCNNFANGCNYDPAVSLYGCVDISGTPVVPGAFQITVTVTADVQLVGNQVISFSMPFTVLQGVVNNPGFSMVNATGCAPLTVDFINNNPGQAAYLWDFGNGLQSILENPPSQTYSTPGTYVVSQTVTPNATPDYFLTDITVTSIPNNYGGFVDDPDMYFLVYDPLGAEVYDSRPSIDNTFPPVTWGVPNIQLQNGNYTVHVWDEDGGLFGADDDLGTVSFAGNGPSGSATGSVGGVSGLLIVDYVIFQTPVVPLTATDTIHVFASPAVPAITASGPLVFCESDSVILTASDSINQVQWYESGVIMAGTTGNIYQPVAGGLYSVTVTTPDGCIAVSAPVQVTIHPLPVKPTFFVNGTTFTSTVTGLNLQWYYNGMAIPGATGSTITATLNGTYQLCGTDSNGCTNCSDTLAFVNTGLDYVETDGGAMLFPNPTSDAFTVLFSNSGERTLVITDALGKEVVRRELSGTSLVEFGKMPRPGVYFIGVWEHGKRYNLRLVVK
jgi:PKD repeat protein